MRFFLPSCYRVLSWSPMSETITANGLVLTIRTENEGDGDYSHTAYLGSIPVTSAYSKQTCIERARAWAATQPSEETNGLAQVQSWENPDSI